MYYCRIIKPAMLYCTLTFVVLIHKGKTFITLVIQCNLTSHIIMNIKRNVNQQIIRTHASSRDGSKVTIDCFQLICHTQVLKAWEKDWSNKYLFQEGKLIPHLLLALTYSVKPVKISLTKMFYHHTCDVMQATHLCELLSLTYARNTMRFNSMSIV